MKHKSVWLAVLVGVNLALLAGLLLVGTPPRAAAAQGAGQGGNYLVVSGQVQNGLDALYVLDLRERALHAFYFEKGARDLKYGSFRDLERDFHSNP